MTPQDFGLRLRKARLQAGLTQEAMASRIGVSRFYVSTWEAGKHTPSAIRVAEMIKSAGLDPKTIFPEFWPS